VQRYIKEWAQALREMAEPDPEVLSPRDGLPVYGADRVQTALTETAVYLEALYAQTVELMNQGATIDELIHEVRAPAHLEDKPFLQPIYDEPEFIVRNIHRCLGGWYSGVPSELKPAPRDEQAREFVSLAGGLGPVLARAGRLLEQENFRLACHLADWAIEAEPESREAHALRAEIYRARSAAESSTMAKGVFDAAARDSSARGTTAPNNSQAP